MDYLALLPFCNTDYQADLINACHETGSPFRAATKLGRHKSNAMTAIRKIKVRAAAAGIAPEADMTKIAAEGFAVKGVSTLYNKDGELTAQWVKTSADDLRRQEMFEAYVEGLKEDLPKYAAVAAPKASNKDLLCQYTITDYHLGMYAWGEESGEDWDLKKAEHLLTAWFETAIDLSPDAEIGLLAQLGDFLHWDGMDAVTPSHGNLLDADTRFQKVIRCCIRVIRRIIALMLAKHQKVHVVMATGNHDLASSAWLRELLAAMYDDEPRITVDTSPDVYYCIQHGKTSLFYHHGHKRKLGNLAEVFAAKFKKQLLSADHAYGHIGHLHHNAVAESSLMTIEQHRTLAPKDAFASSGGYMSGRDAKVITYHKEFGEVSRLTVSPGMVVG